MKRLLTSRALADADRLYEFLAVRNPGAAQRAVLALRSAIQSLEVFPDRGRPTDRPGIRDLFVPFGRSKYVVRYSYNQMTDTLVIMRMWHGRENRP